MVDPLGIVGAFGIGGVMVLLGSSRLKAYLKVRRTDPTDVGAVDGGMDEVELIGTARPAGDPFSAPFSGEDALMYDWKVKRQHTKRGLVKAESGDQRGPFVLADGTGEILVNPENAAINLEEEEWKVDDGEEPPGTIREFLERNDRSSRAASDVIYERDRSFAEGRLDPGEEVYVYGPVKQGPAENAPDGTVGPYVGSEESWSAADDPDRQVSVGQAAESTMFTIADAGEKQSQRRFLTQGLIGIGIGMLFITLAVAFVVL